MCTKVGWVGEVGRAKHTYAPESVYFANEAHFVWQKVNDIYDILITLIDSCHKNTFAVFLFSEKE